MHHHVTCHEGVGGQAPLNSIPAPAPLRKPERDDMERSNAEQRLLLDQRARAVAAAAAAATAAATAAAQAAARASTSNTGRCGGAPSAGLRGAGA